MDSKTRTLVLSIIAAVALWLVGGFVFNMYIGMICVMAGIALVGLAAGNIMNSPEPEHTKAP
ncbi:hypothetical protein [Sideroxydans lithotrophicus]|uniref:Uncharacterized protein n=1 Tax=Sideroxydans lithotrophicus (strain ES-1) TaxID=580332 RepID=D5CMD1_SIDLE|nr:hypothetical protein [Sideroxydans lithotrophicus]ADE12603.1 hypothetical protein Slit_2376 [Sideroxydans lithotrophicus ES-1]